MSANDPKRTSVRSPAPNRWSTKRTKTRLPSPDQACRVGINPLGGMRMAWFGRVLCALALLVIIIGLAPEAFARALLAYPLQGQSPQQQEADRAACADWAVQQSGFDPTRTPYHRTAQAPRRVHRANRSDPDRPLQDGSDRSGWWCDWWRRQPPAARPDRGALCQISRRRSAMSHGTRLSGFEVGGW